MCKVRAGPVWALCKCCVGGVPALCRFGVRSVSALCMFCVSTNIRARRGEREREESDCDLLQSGFFVNHHHLALDLELPKVDVDGGSNHIQLVVVVLLY